LALVRETLVQILQLIAIRKAPKPEQVAGLFKSGMLGEFVNVDAAIGENAAFAIDIADARVGGDNAF